MNLRTRIDRAAARLPRRPSGGSDGPDRELIQWAVRQGREQLRQSAADLGMSADQLSWLESESKPYGLQDGPGRPDWGV